MARVAAGRAKQASPPLTPWALPADFGIETLGDTAADCARQTVDGDRVIDAAAVQRVHAASLQWLLALALASRARGQAFSLHQPSTVLRDAARRLGLAPDLMISPPEECV